jgi:MYXO-CTERM domain-containing protein
MKRIQAIAASVLICAAMLLGSSSAAAIGIWPELAGVAPGNEATVPTNVRFHTNGGEGTAVVTRCDDAEGALEDCFGAVVGPLAAAPGNRGFCGVGFCDDVAVSERLDLEPNSRVGFFVHSDFGNRSARWTVATEADTEAPTAPVLTGGTSDYEWVGGTSGSDQDTITLTWEAATDDFGVAYYRVERETAGGFASEGLRFASRAETYSMVVVVASGTFRISAVDVAGNVSAPSEELRVENNLLASVCTCVSSSASPRPWFGVGVVVWLLVRRRRRRDRSWT